MEVLCRHRGAGRIIRSDPDALARRYRAAVKDMKLKPEVTLESLRNAHGTIAHELDLDIKSISEQYGHGDIKVTSERYVQHSRKAGKRYAATMQTMRKSSRKVPQVGVTDSDR